MRLVICDDHQLLLEALATALAGQGYAIEALATTPLDAVKAVSAHDPDVLLLDVMFPRAHGLSAARRVVSDHPRTKVVMITGSDAFEPLVEALEIGVAGYIRKDQPVAGIAAAVASAADGRPCIDGALLRMLRHGPARVAQQRAPSEMLTSRERNVAELLAVGLSTNQIVHRLGVSHSTVRTHVQNILLKLGVHTRLQAVAKLSADERFTKMSTQHAS